MSETPRTDAFIGGLYDDWDVEFASLILYAKTLERELNNLQAYADKLADGLPKGKVPYSLPARLPAMLEPVSDGISNFMQRIEHIAPLAR